jgi:hypothetical protein
MTLEQRGTASLAIQLFNLKQYVGSSTKELEDTTLYFSRRAIEDIYRDRASRSISEGVDNAFKKMSTGETVRKENEVSYGRAAERPGITSFEKDMGEVAEGLHTKTIVSAFTRATPPKAHCISRALQLISDSGLKSAFPKEVYTHLCKTKFLTDNRSLPPADERITKEDGIYALAQLFFDTLQDATPQISAATQDQYKAFVAKMKFVFEESKDAKAGNARRLDTVINRIPSGICSPDVKDRDLKITNRDLIRQLRDNVRQMITYQINHTANAVKILKKLFLLPIESGKSLQIHPRVLKNGMDEVNAIAEEARNLLVEYYSQCEILYRSGAEILASNKSLLTAV